MIKRLGNLFLIRFKKQLIFRILVVLFVLLLGAPVFAQSQTVNAGMVNGIWYSKLPFFAGDKVKIYTALQNQSGFDIKGTIQFLDDEQLIGESDFSTSDGDFIKEWIEWEVTQGYHYISIRAVNVRKIEGENSEPISLNIDFLGTDKQFADLDTDNDDIGNQEDPDKDNDGITNKKELELGTDPLVADTDKDNINDGEEITRGTDPLVFNKKEESNKLFSEEKLDKIKKLLSLSKAQTNQLRKNLLKVIKEEKNKTQKEIQQSSSTSIVQASITLVKTDFYSLEIPKEKVPSWKQVYDSFLNLNIYVVERPWLLAVCCLLAARLVWKIKKN